LLKEGKTPNVTKKGKAVPKMTDKELMYVEDALSHAKFLQNQCCESASKLMDGDLKSFVNELSTKHQQIFGSFFNLLG